MKKTKIYLQYPWMFPDSPYYRYLLQEHPPEIKYLNAERQKGVITSKRFFWFSNFLKKAIRGTLSFFKIAVPNAHVSKKGDYDLIHCAHCLSLNDGKPWVCDMESEWQFYVGNKNNFVKKEVRKILMKENCKKIMPWTEHTKNEILKEYPEVADKIEVVYPAVPVVKDLKKKDNKNLKIIFVARYFEIKCGLIALETLERLRKKHGIEGIVVSEVPKEISIKYPKIKQFGLLPQKKLFELLSESDIFLYPSAMDTFGFSLLEAMAYGLPIITINTEFTRSRNEIVENKKTGFIFDVNERLSFKEIGKLEENVVEKLVSNSEKLILDKKLREEMRRDCLNEIKKGKFSIDKRNKQIKRIYREAVRR